MKQRNKMSKYRGLYTFDTDNHKYVTLPQTDEIIDLLDTDDYVPAEPLIKDEKIRKAVRAWAEANIRDLFRVINEHFNCCKIIGYCKDGGDTSCDKIGFSTTIAGAKKDSYYTIAELYGEEEE